MSSIIALNKSADTQKNIGMEKARAICQIEYFISNSLIIFKRTFKILVSTMIPFFVLME